MRLRTYSSILLLCALIPSAAFAQGSPGIPEAFHGHTHARPGGKLAAKIGVLTVASTTIATDGTYGYAPDIFLIPDPDRDRTGDTISFSIDGRGAIETAIFTNGTVRSLDLTFPGEDTTTSTSTANTDVASGPEQPAGTTTQTYPGNGRGNITVSGTDAISITPSGSGAIVTPDESTRGITGTPILQSVRDSRVHDAAVSDASGFRDVKPTQTSRKTPYAFALAAVGSSVNDYWQLGVLVSSSLFFLYALAVRVRRGRAQV